MRLLSKNRKSLISKNFFAKATSGLDRQQHRIAGYLGRKTQYWNRNAKITALALFCLVFGGICLLLFIRSVVH